MTRWSILPIKYTIEVFIVSFGSIDAAKNILRLFENAVNLALATKEFILLLFRW